MNWRGLQDGMAEKLFVSTPSKDIQHLEPKEHPHDRLLSNVLGILHHIRLVMNPSIALFWFFPSSASENRAGVCWGYVVCSGSAGAVPVVD